MANKFMKKCSTILAARKWQPELHQYSSVSPQREWISFRKQTINASKDAGKMNLVHGW
jgi:hypothetical protein